MKYWISRWKRSINARSQWRLGGLLRGRPLLAIGAAIALIAAASVWLSLWGLASRNSTRRFEIASHSMAPTLEGPTFQFQCLRCARYVGIAVERSTAQSLSRADQPLSALPRCLHCGGSLRPALACTECGIPVVRPPAGLAPAPAPAPEKRARRMPCGCEGQADFVAIPGDTVTLKPLDSAGPRRFDLLAFQLDNIAADYPALGPEFAGNAPLVKRVLGMPGEHVHFKDGDLFIDGQRFQKSLDQLRSMAIRVATIEDWHRWQGLNVSREQVSSQSHGMTWVSRYLASADSAVVWTHQIPAKVRTDESPVPEWLAESPVLDDYNGNQLESWNMRAVQDLMLEIKLASDLSEPMRISIAYLGQLRHIVLQPAGARPSRNRTIAAQAMCKRNATLACCDHRLLIETDLESSETPVQRSAMSSDSEIESTVELTVGGIIEFETLTIYRDLHLRSDFPRVHPHESVSTFATDGAALGEQSYFVVGDNLPVSLDSRNCLGPIPADSILGRVEKSKNAQ